MEIPGSGVVLSILPPWLVLALPLGMINAAGFFILFGRRLPLLGWYAGIGALAASVGQVFATAVAAPAPLQIGELNVLAASAAVWLVLALVRSAGL